MSKNFLPPTYRRLVAITGVGLPANPAAPDPADPNLAARRWLAQLAVNIVDFIDEDDISTPFNFYNVADGLATANIGATQGKDDNDPTGNPDAQPTGANPIYWVFGTEMPKVVLNEVLAEAQDPDPTQAAVDGESVKVWLELFNTMQPPAMPTNTQAQDTYRVPLYMTIPGGAAGAAGAAGTGYSPYRITIAQTPMNQPITGAATTLPDATSNVLGKAYIAAPFPQSTTDADFANPISLIGGGNQAAFPIPGSDNTINAGVDPGSFFLIGPPVPGDKYKDPFVAATGTDPGVPPTTPVLRTANVTYKPTWTGASTTDERTTGLTVMLRRLANPYLPFNPFQLLPDGTPNPQYNSKLPINPYVTIDYIQYVPIQSNKVGPASMLVRSDAPTPSNNIEPARAQVRSNGTIQSNTRLVQSSPAAALYASRGKTQPYAAYTTPRTDGGVPQAPAGSNGPEGSPVINQEVNAAGTPTAITTPAGVTHSFGRTNYPLPPSKHYDWLVHLDRQAISPMELLHVSGCQPYQLTQRFLLGSDVFAPPNQANVTNLFRHYVPWLDAPLSSPSDSIINMSCPWWFDANLPADQSHRLYRLFEFLECGDRASGISINTVTAPDNIPGKVNINTIWDPEIFRAICDANLSIGLPSDDSITDQIFQQLIASRSPNLANNTIGPVNIAADSVPTSYQLDRPFLPLSTGLSATGQQYPSGAGIQDTILRPNPSNNMLRLLQNPSDTSNIHPYLQTQLLTKIYNNLTTRSNVFAVWVTVGFFEVTDPGTNPPTLGAEIGRSEGRHVRHRMFAIVNRASVSFYSGPPPPGTPFDPRLNANAGVVPYYSIID